MVTLMQSVVEPVEDRFHLEDIKFSSYLIDCSTYLINWFPASAAMSFCLLGWTIVNLYGFLVDDVKAFTKRPQWNQVILENRIHIDRWRRQHFLLRQLSDKLTQCFDLLLLICIICWLNSLVTTAYILIQSHNVILKSRDTLVVAHHIFHLAIINFIPTKIQQQVWGLSFNSVSFLDCFRFYSFALTTFICTGMQIG